MTTPLDLATLRVMSTECVCFNLRRSTRAVTQLYDQVLAPSGLRGTQVSLLVVLARIGEGPSAQVAEILGMDPTTLSRNLAPLRRAGLLSFIPGRPDRRVKLVTLTPKGRRALAAAIPLWEAAQRQITEALGPGRWATLRHEIERISTLAGAGS